MHSEAMRSEMGVIIIICKDNLETFYFPPNVHIGGTKPTRKICLFL